MLPDRRQPHAIFRVSETIMVVKISQGKKYGQHSIKLFSCVKAFFCSKNLHVLTT